MRTKFNEMSEREIVELSGFFNGDAVTNEDAEEYFTEKNFCEMGFDDGDLDRVEWDWVVRKAQQMIEERSND